jgi:hypothetical protein
VETDLVFEVECTGGHEVIVALLHPGCSRFEVRKRQLGNATIVVVGDAWKNA